MNFKKGISLISLVVTIIVLLVIVAVVVAFSIDGNLLGLTRETKEDAIIAGINGYAQSVKSVIVLDEDISEDEIVDVFISQVEADNMKKDEKDKYEIVAHDKINKTVTLKKDNVEVVIDLSNLKDISDPSDISKDNIASRHTITFKYKEQDKEQEKKMIVMRNQTLQDYLNTSGDSIPSGVTEWVPEIQYNTPVVANMQYRQYIENLNIVNAHFNLAGGTLNGETTVESKEYYIGDIVKDIGTPAKEHHNFTGWLPPLEEEITETTTYVAQWTTRTYTFTFKMNGGNIGGSTADRTTSGTYGTSSSIPANPTRTYYTFSGWSPSVPSTYTGNNTYTAQWTAITYTYTFDLNGGSIGGSTANRTTSGTYETTATTPGTPTRTHHTFSGWSPSLPSTYTGNRTYTAQWTIITYTFTFNLNGGSIGGSTANRTTSGNSGSTSSTPGTPTRTGCTFDGWSPTVPGTFNGNTTFTAQWRVTFTFDNGRTTTGLVGTPSSTPSNPTKTGHTFSGWSPSVPSTFDQNRTFTPTWTIVTYTFTFNLNGGSIGGSSANKTTSGDYGSTSSTPGTPTRTGCTFDGWSPAVPGTFDQNRSFTAQWRVTFTFDNGRTTTGLVGTPSSTPSNPTREHYTFNGWSPTVPATFDQNKTFTAQWTAATYTFTFNMGGGTSGGSTANQTFSGTYGTASKTPTNPTRTHYTFTGWSPSVPATFDGNRTFTAQWSIITYTFTFKLNGGSIGGSTADRTTSGNSGSSSSTPGTPTRTHYTFTGWSPSVPSTFNGNNTYTAQWSIISYTFTFKLNGGSIGGSTADRTTNGNSGSSSSTPGTPTRTHYTFTGWSPSVPSTFNGNNTYTAQWSIISYTFTFKLNGGSIGGSTADRTTKGNSGSSSSTPGTPTRTHYTFTGWSPSVPSTFNGNNTYTAQWSIIKYTFTFNLNGGSIGGSTANRTTNGNSGSSSSTPGTPTRTGYTFGGWNPAVPSTFNGNNTYTAKWTVITYTISYDRNGGSGTFASQTRTHGGAYVYTHSHSPTRSGYTFNGWLSHMRPDRLYPPNTPYGWDASTTMVAQWTKNIVYYTITYNLNGGRYNNSTTNPTRSVQAGTMPPNLTPTRTNYKFQGWSPALANATANRTYTAQWKTVTVFYKITYKLAGGTYNGSTADVIREIEEGVMPPNLTPVRNNYTFNGWNPSLQKALAAKIYTAKWTAGGGVSPYSMDLMASSLSNDPVYHNITYDLNGGTYDGSTTNPTSLAEKGTLPPDLTPTRNGYSFNGWSPSLTKVTGDKTYKAQWTPITYVITYNLNGGTYNGSTVNPIRDVGYNTMPPELIPTRNGYVFLEWSPNMTAVTENKTYIAVWSFPMILEMKKASLNEEILIPIEISRGNSAYISNNGGEYIKYTANNPTITNTVPAGEVFEIKIAGRINRIDYSDKPTEKQAQLYRILDWGELGAIDFSKAFYKCTNLKGPIPLPGPNSFINVTSFAGTFYDCSSLTGIPTGLFDNCPNVTSFEETFSYCTALTGEAPALWLTHSNANGRHCFYYCTNLYNYSKIDSAWK